MNIITFGGGQVNEQFYKLMKAHIDDVTEQ